MFSFDESITEVLRAFELALRGPRLIGRMASLERILGYVIDSKFT